MENQFRMMKQKFQQRNLLIDLFEVTIPILIIDKIPINLISECENFLKELDLKLVWPATKVLQSVARANSTCASLIWSSILPLLIKLFNNLEQVFRFIFIYYFWNDILFRLIIKKQFLIWLLIFFKQQVNFLSIDF